MTCETCETWTRHIGEYSIPNTGICMSAKMVHIDRNRKCPKDSLGYEGFYASFITGEDFGCIHHKIKPPRP